MDNTLKVMIIAVIGLCLILALLFSQSQSFKVDRLEYFVSNNGNAFVVANYHLNLVEKFWLVLPMTKDGVIHAIKTEYGEESKIISITDTSTTFTIPRFADVYPTYIQTPMLTFENIKKRSNEYWFVQLLNIDYTPTITTMKFYNGETHSYTNMMVVPAITVFT